MAIFFPDLSHYEAGVSLAGVPALITKATQGRDYIDPTYAGYKAAANGLPFAGYHWVESGALSSIADQAAHALAVIGRSTPMMADIEVLTSSTGHQSWPTFDEALDWCRRVLAGGGQLTLAYIPKWFWSGHWGGTSLKPFADLGLALISSQYTTYSDTGPGWAPYGGWTPTIWQYTNAGPLNGRTVDMNAFKGTATELRRLFTLDNNPPDQGVDMALTDADAALVAAKVWGTVIGSAVVSPATDPTHATALQAARDNYIRLNTVANVQIPGLDSEVDGLTAAETDEAAAIAAVRAEQDLIHAELASLPAAVVALLPAAGDGTPLTVADVQAAVAAAVTGVISRTTAALTVAPPAAGSGS